MLSSNVSVETAKYDALNIDRLQQDKTMSEGFIVGSKTNFVAYNMAQPAIFTNENNDYIHRSKTNDGVALTVAGSFDQVIDLARLGYSIVIAVDVNRYQYYVDYLKYLAVRYLDYFSFMVFLADAQSPKCFDEEIIRYLFDKAEVDNEPSRAAPEMFWKTLLRNNTAMQIRMKYIMGEKHYILHDSNRLLRSKYILSLSDYQKAQTALGKTKINFYIGDVFEISKENYFPKRVYDIVLLSNVHNFAMADMYVHLVRSIVPYVKTGGSIFSYLIQIPREWIERSNVAVSYIDWKKTILNDFNKAAIECQAAHRSYFVEAFRRQFKTRVHEVATGGGYACFYNTSTDSVLEIIV